jgi:hypothetical protein
MSLNRSMANLIDGSGSLVDGGLTVYSSVDNLPTTGLTSGDQAFISSTSRMYISNGSGWYNVALINATPTLTISPSGAIALEIDGSTPTVITLTGTDSDNADANLTYTVESDGSFANIATLSQDSSVFTITPLAEGSATPGSSTLTFKVSDGISFGSGTTALSLAFTTDWSSASTSEVVLTPSGIGNSDRFGYDHFGLSTDGTYLVVGAAQEDTTNSNQGKAWVFKYSGSSWSEEATLFPPSSDNKASLNFGQHADISGDGSVAIISALNYGTYTGAVYVYTRSGTTWSYGTRLTASDAANYDAFGGEGQGQGIGISKDGTYIIAGAHQDDDGGSNRGSAYVFTGSGASWSQQQKLAPSYTSGSSVAYGNAVVINNDGTYCAVAAKNMNKNGTSTNTGVVFIYTRSGSTWTEQAYVSPSDGAASDNFGWHISMNGAGDRLLVYSRYDDDGGDSTGSIYVYTRSGSTWTQAAKVTKTSPSAYDYWGKVSLNETGDVFVTSGDTTSNSVAGSGKLYVYKDNSSGTDGTSWSLVRTLTTAISETYGLGNDYGTVKISRDTSTIVNTAGKAPNGTDQGRAYIFNT